MDSTAPGWRLEEARFRLAYINQHREVTLGGFFLLACCARLFAVPVPRSVLLLLAAWFAVSVLFVRAARRCRDESGLHRLEVNYFLLELALITLLAHFLAAADWLAVMLYAVTVLYANVVLPRRYGVMITLLAATSFTLLVLAEYLRLVPHHALPGIPARADDLPYLTVTVVVGAIAGNGLIGLTSFQFARMLTAKAEALFAANTGLKAASVELRMHRNHLEVLVEQRTADLRQALEDLSLANQELRRLNEVKSNFLANVSHELRTPLTSIRSFSEILLTYPDEEQGTRQEFLEIIIHESDRLTRLINDVLDLAKIEAGQSAVRFQTVRLQDVVKQSVDLFQVQAEQQGIQLVNTIAADLPALQADPDRMAQVFANLLSNALKFSAAGRVEIGSQLHPDQVWFFVADDGPGLPPEARDAIFEKFHQHGDLLTGKPPGTGLGLAICREIMQQHNGRIWVESEVGQGATFYCSLPLQPEATAVPANADVGAEAGA